VSDNAALDGTTPARGILAFGAYVPRGRLALSEIGEVLDDGRSRRGERPVASYDEDTTTLAVEACRNLFESVSRPDLDAVVFSTPSPAYLEKSNAAVLHSALHLPDGVAAYDFLGSGRSSVGSLALSLRSEVTTLVASSDIRNGLPGSADEMDGADAATAFLVGTGDPLVVPRGFAAVSREYLDKWRLPGEPVTRSWEDRFGDDASINVADEAIHRLLKSVGLQPSDVDWLVVGGVRARTAGRIRALIPEAKAPSGPSDIVGAAGSAQLGLDLIRVLEAASPSERILCLSVSDGADAILLETTDAVSRLARRTCLDEQASDGTQRVPYAAYLSWRGMLQRDPPRRPDPARPSAPAARRSEHWKFGLVGSQCTACDQRFLPPQRVCLDCGAADVMVPNSFADVPARVATFTIDYLAYSPSPPVIAAIVDFEGGGRLPCELTDVDPGSLRVGQPVTMTFRRLYTAGGIHNYFWKARPDERH
jgi:3-hydroxy-3-methylglutaryl CoA synthase